MTGFCVLVYKHTAENDMQENENIVFTNLPELNLGYLFK